MLQLRALVHSRNATGMVRKLLMARVLLLLWMLKENAAVWIGKIPSRFQCSLIDEERVALQH
eukprot:1158230-Pelagomonas_calceolata.AAC.1